MADQSGPILLHTAQGRFTGDGQAQFDLMIDQLTRSSAPKLLLHVHGGLVSDAAADAEAAQLDQLGQYGGLRQDGWTTAYFIWESSLGETIRNNQDELSRQPLLIQMILDLLGWVAGDDSLLALKVGQDALAEAQARFDREPPTATALTAAIADDMRKVEFAAALADDQLLGTLLAERLRGDQSLARLIASLDQDIAGGRGAASRLDDSVLTRIQARRLFGPAAHAGASDAAAVIFPDLVRAGLRCIWRFLNHRDHGVYCTVAEEVVRAFYLANVGAEAWTLMKEDTARHFDPGAPGDLLVTALSGWAKAGKAVRVLFVGHSAGAVFGCHFAQRCVQAPPGLTLDYAFLAPAARMDLAAQTLPGNPAGVSHIRIFTMDDAREKADALDGTAFGKIYPRSLLYLISGVLETDSRGKSYADAPLLGLQRHLATDRGLDASEKKARAAVLSLVSGQLVYAGEPSGGNGRQCDTHSHGATDQDPETVASVIWIARHGF